MEKMFNFISVIGGLVGGFIVSLFGGWDVMLYTILLFAIKGNCYCFLYLQ